MGSHESSEPLLKKQISSSYCPTPSSLCLLQRERESARGSPETLAVVKTPPGGTVCEFILTLKSLNPLQTPNGSFGGGKTLAATSAHLTTATHGARNYSTPFFLGNSFPACSRLEDTFGEFREG